MAFSLLCWSVGNFIWPLLALQFHLYVGRATSFKCWSHNFPWMLVWWQLLLNVNRMSTLIKTIYHDNFFICWFHNNFILMLIPWRKLSSWSDGSLSLSWCICLYVGNFNYIFIYWQLHLSDICRIIVLLLSSWSYH